MALLTMALLATALLTVALLTMAPLTTALLTMAGGRSQTLQRTILPADQRVSPTGVAESTTLRNRPRCGIDHVAAASASPHPHATPSAIPSPLAPSAISCWQIANLAGSFRAALVHTPNLTFAATVSRICSAQPYKNYARKLLTEALLTNTTY